MRKRKINTKIQKREATPEEIRQWLVQNKLFEPTPSGKLRPTLQGLKFIASRPPGEVTKVLP